jgi:CPA2 family monovalent cation:H+ antiporter-2
MIDSLGLVVLLLAAAVCVVVVFRSLQLPPLIGYLLVGIVVGPGVLGWASSTRETAYLAEFGIVFLMFTIGLEFSLPRLMQMRRVVLGLGGLQVVATVCVIALGFALAGSSWKVALALGAILAMSSTAIAVRLLAERRELEMPHGREAFGVLLFQDLAVVPLLILIPALASADADLLPTLGWAAAKIVGVLALILVVGQRLMRSWFRIVAARRSNELFILNVLLITLGLAWITESAGLSLALGAFLAGVLISETEYRLQVEEDIKPFREVLLGLFFVSIGMQVDIAVVVREAALVIVLVIALLAAKMGIVFGLSRLFGSPAGTALKSAIALAQAGEFGLVLAALASEHSVVSGDLLQPVFASMLLTMMIGPVLIHYSERITMRLVRSEWMMQSLALHQLAVRSFGTERHVVLCGYGRTGQAIARLLERAKVSYVALDLDPDRVREADAAGDFVVFGDASRREILVAAGLSRASAVVVTHTDSAAALRTLAHVRELRPTVPVIVRTTDDTRLDQLTTAGATEVVPDTFEASLMLASHALVLIGTPLRTVLHEIREVRDQRYALMRGFFHGQSDEAESLEDTSQPRLHSVVLETGSHAIGRSIRELALEDCAASVTALRRNRLKIAAPPGETVLEPGDVLVLKGTADGVSAAEMRLLQGT